MSGALRPAQIVKLRFPCRFEIGAWLLSPYAACYR